jgi:DNA-binding response OmpR family regulator
MTTHVTPDTQCGLSPHEDGTHTILIVDRDVDQAFCLSRRLSTQGFITVTADRGLLAMGIAQAETPDLILLDVSLPDRDGLDVCRDLTDSPVTCHIPIIVLSDLAHPNMVRLARSAGCEFFLRKPYDPNVLLTLIEATLGDNR